MVLYKVLKHNSLCPAALHLAIQSLVLSFEFERLLVAFCA